MAMIAADKIEEVRARSNIVDIIGEYTDLKRTGSSFKGLCPFHNEKTPSFTVDDKKQLFHCFGCGAGGDVVSFIMQKEGLSYPESIEYLADKAGITLEYSGDKRVNERNEKLYELNKTIMMYFYKNLLTSKKAIGYLKQRGLSSKIVNRFMLGYAISYGNDLMEFAKANDIAIDDLIELGLVAKNDRGEVYDKYRDRIIFPIINHYGKVIGFGGRSIGDKMPKYLNSPESAIFKKRYNLYGLNVYKKQKSRDMILVEGYMDVIALNNHGVDYAVASLGTALTADQAKLMDRYADDIYICYDRDEAGKNATDKAIKIFLSLGIKPKIISLEEDLDPDDYIKEYGKDAFLKKKDEAMDVYNYQYNQILDIYAGVNENEKLDKLDLFVEFLAGIESDLSREIFTNNVSTLFNIDKATLNNAVNKYSTNISSPTQAGYEKKQNPRISTQDMAYEHNPNELEVLRLIFNQRDDYLKHQEFFDKSLKEEKIINVRDFIVNKDTRKFDQNDQDYTYILNYIRDNTNPIEVNELMEKIELYNRKNKFKHRTIS